METEKNIQKTEIKHTESKEDIVETKKIKAEPSNNVLRVNDNIKIKDKDAKEKTEAIVNGKDLGISTKHAVAICNFIKGKNIDKAILILEDVAKLKKPVPMKGEIPHRKGNIMSGRYPVKASKVFIQLLKSLKSNAIAKGLEIENYIISCKANKASRPYRRFTRFGSRQFKRTHVELKLIIKTKVKK